jgi:hypothetical protein
MPESHGQECSYHGSPREANSICIRCPYHIGVVLSDRFDADNHLPSQQYYDTFDNTSRAKDAVQWAIAKGDLICPSEPLRTTVTILRRLTHTSRPTGTVTIVMSKAEEIELTRHFFTEGDASKAARGGAYLSVL